MRFMVGGVEPKLVMSGIRQIWPKILNREDISSFTVVEDFLKFPYQGFDGRTEAGSRLAQAAVSENGLLAQQNFAPNLSTPIGKTTILGGRSMRAIVRNLRWEVNNSGRIHQVSTTGTTITIGDTNGVDTVTTAPFDVPANGTVILRVLMNTANIPDTARVLKSGSIELIPA